MEIKVRDLGQVEEKSKAEIEEELLKKHEEKFEDTDSKPQIEKTEEVVAITQVIEDNVLVKYKDA